MRGKKAATRTPFVEKKSRKKEKINREFVVAITVLSSIDCRQWNRYRSRPFEQRFETGERDSGPNRLENVSVAFLNIRR